MGTDNHIICRTDQRSGRGWPGTRITVTGPAYIEYAQGNLQDAKTACYVACGLKARVTACATQSGRMTIRATALRISFVLIEEGFRDADTDSGYYWQEQAAQLATDAAGNVSGLVGRVAM